ncbi:MAG: hypothetical protein GX230_06550 [Lentisphaerae bacterium]|nr:hypothetical protein [Lentisphaerota bacterium]
MKLKLTTALLLLCAVSLTSFAQNESQFRFYQGLTAYVDNPEGVDFNVTLDVRDWNMLENGPRELLLKIYDPEGYPVVREVVPDDGITGEAFMPETGGWDHEMWYYTLCYSRGTVPMTRWSAYSDPGRVAMLAHRTFTYNVKGTAKGVYRILLSGSRDHVVNMRLSPNLKYGLAGHPNWLHGHGDMFKQAYIYVPKGTVNLHLGFLEYDQPVTRNFTVKDAAGEILFDGSARGGFRETMVTFDPPNKYDDQILTVEVSDGSGAYMLHCQLGRPDVRFYRGIGGPPAVLTPDPTTAKALRGGAIYHDNKVFWHGFQIRLHEWLKKLKPEDFIVHGPDGKVIEPTIAIDKREKKEQLSYAGLPKPPIWFAPLNGNHEAPPSSDLLMHQYLGYKNPGILNNAVRDLQIGLNSIAVGDLPVTKTWTANMGYVFGTYSFHYWRPMWRILQQSDAPAELKAIIREALILCGDRIAFCRGIERTNGNAFGHIAMALRYAAAGADDPMLTALSDQFFERFSNGSWGRGVGLSRSGDCQEHFAHDYHYGSYIISNFRAISVDLKDDRFTNARQRMIDLYSYLYCRELPAYPWGSRTHQQGFNPADAWKANPGPDFTVNVNNGDEWFAARRQNYYALTFFGHLCPTWLNNYYDTRIGYGGGILCQITIPEHGTVIASNLQAAYGSGMQPRNWRNFHIHSVVGTMADDTPFVGADSEHLNAALDNLTVSGSGEVRDRAVRSARSYTFGDHSITCRVSLADTHYRAALWNHGPTAHLKEAYEMIPFIPSTTRQPTTVALLDAEGNSEVLTKTLTPANGFIIDRKGYGVTINFNETRNIQLGQNNTVLIELITQRTHARDISFEYTLTPYVGEPGAKPTPPKPPQTLKKLADTIDPAAISAALADTEASSVADGKRHIADIRFGVTDNALAVTANVVDSDIRPNLTPWRGSCVEIFGSLPEATTVGQIFLVPGANDKPAVAYRQDGGKQIANPAIKVTSQPCDNGYEISALIPLALLTLDPNAKTILLEAQVTSTDPQKKLTPQTAFGSTRAYMNNRNYAPFQIPTAP